MIGRAENVTGRVKDASVFRTTLKIGGRQMLLVGLDRSFLIRTMGRAYLDYLPIYEGPKGLIKMDWKHQGDFLEVLNKRVGGLRFLTVDELKNRSVKKFLGELSAMGMDRIIAEVKETPNEKGFAVLDPKYPNAWISATEDVHTCYMVFIKKS